MSEEIEDEFYKKDGDVTEGQFSTNATSTSTRRALTTRIVMARTRHELNMMMNESELTGTSHLT